MKKIILPTTLFALLTACASLPDAQIDYYAAKSTTTITLTQHLTCDREFTKLFEAANLTTAASHSADTTNPYQIRLRNFDGNLSSGSVSINHFADGRLNSINASSTGQGMAIIQSSVAVAGSVFGLSLGGGLPGLDDEGDEVEDANLALIKAVCNNINPRASQNKQLVDNVLMLTFTARHSDANPNPKFTANATTKTRLESLKNAINIETAFLSPSITVSSTPQPDCLVKTRITDEYKCNEQSIEGDKKIRVQRSKSLKFEVKRDFDIKVKKIINQNQETLTANAQVADKSFYYVPYKSESLFGSNMMALTLSPMGTVMNISYNSTNGAAQALNSANSILGEFQGQTVQEAANEIAQTQRLIRCRAEPVSCQ